jgi:hypothetical protein
VTVTPGGRGQFDVIVDGDVVAMKHGTGMRHDKKGFPDDDDAVAAVRTKLGR